MSIQKGWNLRIVWSLQDSEVYSCGENDINEMRVNRTIYRYSRLIHPLSGRLAISHSEDMKSESRLLRPCQSRRAGTSRIVWSLQDSETTLLCGENIFSFRDEIEDDADYISSTTFTGWLNSPGHYKNMIKKSYDTGGIGVFVKPKIIFGDARPRRFDIYVTHLLCRDMTEYNKLRDQHQEAEAIHDSLAADYERIKEDYQKLEAEYKEMEDQHVMNTVPYSEVDKAYTKLEDARTSLNDLGQELNNQVDELNDLVEQMNAAGE